MNTTKRSSKKKTTMRGGGGFMCHSAAATAVHTCTVSDPRSVIVPRPSNHRTRHHHHQFDHTTLLFKNAKYSKLVHDHCKRSASTSTSSKDISVITPNHHNHRRSTALVSSIIKKDEDHNPSSRDHHKSSKLIMQQQQQQKQPITTPNSLVTTTSSADQVFQVVVMRVSIHCQGCAGKLKKHLSKMEGVTSFSIDLETKRVTVMGHVSPVAVLESISKVKRAEFWPCN